MSMEKNLDEWNQILRITKDKYFGSKLYDTQLYSVLPDLPNIKPVMGNIILQPWDTLKTVQYYSKKSQKICILNFANPIAPAADDIMHNTQEEILFRDTDLHKYLSRDFYPIMDETVLYSRNVVLLRDRAPGKLFDIDDKLIKFDVISSCALINPAIDCPSQNIYNSKGRNLPMGQYALLQDYIAMVKRIEMIYRVAIDNQVDTLILGAYGCGAFNNPTKHVADIFRDLSNKYTGFIKNIVFAVINGNLNEKRKDSTESTYSIFQRAFNK